MLGSVITVQELLCFYRFMATSISSSLSLLHFLSLTQTLASLSHTFSQSLKVWKVSFNEIIKRIYLPTYLPVAPMLYSSLSFLHTLSHTTHLHPSSRRRTLTKPCKNAIFLSLSQSYDLTQTLFKLLKFSPSLSHTHTNIYTTLSLSLSLSHTHILTSFPSHSLFCFFSRLSCLHACMSSSTRPHKVILFSFWTKLVSNKSPKWFETEKEEREASIKEYFFREQLLSKKKIQWSR